MSTKEIVDVQIDLKTATVSRASFSLPLILGDTDPAGMAGIRSKLYSSDTYDTAMVADGFTSSDPEYGLANAVFSRNPTISQVRVGVKRAPDTNWTDALIAIKNTVDDWFAVLAEPRGVSAEADNLAIANWIEAQKKVYIIASDDSEIIDTTEGADTGSIAKQIKDAGLERTAVFYSATADSEYIDGAFLGEILPKDPGSYTGAFKSLSGITIDALTSDQVANALSKNANVYTEVGGVNITRLGTMGSGEYIDVIIFIDWLRVRMTERIYARFVNLDKIPYTDAGINVIVTEIEGQLIDGINIGGLTNDPAPTVTAPKASEVSSVDRGNRLLKDVKFTAFLAGAIHKAEIRGSVFA